MVPVHQACGTASEQGHLMGEEDHNSRGQTLSLDREEGSCPRRETTGQPSFPKEQ